MRLFYKLFLSICFVLNTVFLVTAQNFELDEDFESNVSTAFTGGDPLHMIFDSNGKLIIAGDFTAYNGTSREGLVRLNTDGTLDTGFGDLSSTFTGSTITDIEIDANDNLYISGDFSAEVIMVDNTGAIDGTFSFSRTNLTAGGSIQEIALDEQFSKLYVAQEISGDVELAQLSTNPLNAGDEDTDFGVKTLTHSTSNAKVNDLAIDSDFDVIIVGLFNNLNGSLSNPTNVARFDVLFGNFDLDLLPNFTTAIEEVEVRSDGQILLIEPNNFNVGFYIRRYEDNGDFIQTHFISTTGTIPLAITGFSMAEDDSYFFVTGEFGVVFGDGTDISTQDVFAGAGFDGTLSSQIDAFAYNASSEDMFAFGSFDIYAGNSVDNFVKLSKCDNISINEQPEAVTKCEGETAVFTIDATGTSLTYQWQINTNDGEGLFTDLADDATYSNTATSELSINDIDLSLDNNVYRVIISDADCNSTSDQVTLNVTEAPTFTTQPSDVTACQFDGGIQFSTTIAGNSGSLRWQVDSLTGSGFVDLPQNGNNQNVFTNTLTLNNINSVDSDGYQFRLVAAGCETEVYSAPATLNVNPAPEATIAEGSEQGLCESGDASFTISSDESNLTYQWQRYNNTSFAYEDLADGGVYSGVNSASLQITGADASMDQINTNGAVQYKCIITNTVTNCERELTSNLVIVESEPSRSRITRQPGNRTECDNSGDGRNINFNIQSDLQFGESVQWQVDSTDGNGFINIEGENSNRLDFVSFQEYNDLEYRAVILPCGEVSDAVQATIDIRPNITIDNGLEGQFTETCENEETILVAKSDQENVSYQWEYRVASNASYTSISDDDNFVGANNDTLRILNNSGSRDRYYRCLVTTQNGLCETNSQGDVRVRVYRDPNFTSTSNTGDQTLCQNTNGVFERSLSNYDGINANFFSYQWQVSSNGTSFVDLTGDSFHSGTNERVLSIDSAALDLDSNYYRLSITGCSSNFYSDTSQLFIEEAPIITAQPEDQTICFDQDEEAVFTVGTEGDNIDVFWERSSTIDGTYSFYQNVDTLVLDGNRNSNFDLDGYYFRARVVNGSNCQQTIYSDSVQFNMNELTLLGGPIAEANATGNLICPDSETYLYVSTRGASLNYQWQVDEGNGFVDLAESGIYSSVNNDTLRFIVSDENLNFNYQCIISGLCESITSEDINISSTVVQSDIPIIEATRIENGEVELFVQNISSSSLIWYDEDGNQFSTQARPLVSSTGIYSVEVIVNGCGFMSEPFEVTETILSVKDAFTAKLYPNPAANQLKVDLGNMQHGTTEIMIYEANGALIRSEESRTQNVSINVSDLKKGIYFLIIQGERGTVKRKFIKE